MIISRTWKFKHLQFNDEDFKSSEYSENLSTGVTSEVVWEMGSLCGKSTNPCGDFIYGSEPKGAVFLFIFISLWTGSSTNMWSLFFFFFFLCSNKKNPNPIQTWAAVETSDSVTLDASTANTHRCRGCLKEKSNDGFTALVCHYISASVPKIPYATAVAMETVFGRIGEAQCKRTFCLCFELMDLLILWVTLCELA